MDDQPAPSGPDAPVISATGWDLSSATASPPPGCATCSPTGTSRGRSRRGRVGPAPRRAPSRERGLEVPGRHPRHRPVRFRRLRGHRPAAPRVLDPEAKLAIAEGDLTGRRRVSTARLRPRKRQSAGFFEDLKPGNYVVHHQHGVGQYEGMVKRTTGGVERTTRFRCRTRAATSSTSRATRSTRSASTPAARHRRCTGLGGADFLLRRPSRAWVSAVREIAQELVVLYQKRAPNVSGFGARSGHPVAGRDGRRLPYAETPDQLKALDDIKADMERAFLDGPPALRRRRLRQDRGGGPGCVQGHPGRQAVAVLAPTTLLPRHAARQHLRRPVSAGFPIRAETLSRFLTAKECQAGARGVEVRRGRLQDRYAPSARRRRSLLTSAC
ncbi:MAG: CarD family transcriptional regulator [Ilumatobacteraceae bacterium]